MNKQENGRITEWVSGRMDERMDGWMDVGHRGMTNLSLHNQRSAGSLGSRQP